MSALIDASEIARRLTVSKATAYREMRARMLHVVVGRRALRVTEAAFAAYLQRRTESPWETGLTRRAHTRPRAAATLPAAAVVSPFPGDATIGSRSPPASEGAASRLTLRVVHPRPRTRPATP
jgi:hypothetical protein